MKPFPVAVTSTPNFLAKPGILTFLTISGDAHAVGGYVVVTPSAPVTVNESSTGDCHCCVRPVRAIALGESFRSAEFQPLRERVPVTVTMSPSRELSSPPPLASNGRTVAWARESGEAGEEQAAVEAPSASTTPAVHLFMVIPPDIYRCGARW